MEGKVRLPIRVAIFLYNQTTTTQDKRTGRAGHSGEPTLWIILVTSLWFDVFSGAWWMKQELYRKYRHKTQRHCQQTGWCFDGILTPLMFIHLNHHQDNHQLSNRPWRWGKESAANFLKNLMHEVTMRFWLAKSLNPLRFTFIYLLETSKNQRQQLRKGPIILNLQMVRLRDLLDFAAGRRGWHFGEHSSFGLLKPKNELNRPQSSPNLKLEHQAHHRHLKLTMLTSTSQEKTRFPLNNNYVLDSVYWSLLLWQRVRRDLKVVFPPA